MRATTAVIAGLALVAGHAIAFVAVSRRSAGQELAVEVTSPLASPTLTLEGKVPAALRSRVVASVDGRGPGVRRARWRVEYRGDHTREVGASQLVGPFQDHPACSGRVVVGQALLDQIAVALQGVLDQQLRGEEVFPIGAYRRLEALELQWAQLAFHPLDAGLLGGPAPNGYVRATARIVFDRVTVPLTLVAVPLPGADHQLHFRVEAHATIEVGNRALQWLNSHVDLTSKLATRIANHELEAMLVTALAPPPPFELDREQTLTFTFCEGAVEIAERAYGALPFAVQLGRAPLGILPPHFVTPHVAPSAPVAPTSLAIELDVDALNALLYELWRTGWLDKRLDEIGLDRRFNADPTVTDLLSVRLSPLRLALPPVFSPAGDHLELTADARVTLADRGTTIGRLFGQLQLRFAGAQANARIGALELACERTPTTLVPCYADLVAAVAGRGREFDGALSDAFTGLLKSIFVDRSLAAGALPGTLTIHGVTPSLARGATMLHLDLDATLMR